MTETNNATMSNRDRIQCDSCGIEMWDNDVGRREMDAHEDECNWTDDPRERFDVGDRVQFSAFGELRLDEDDREGEVVGFSEEDHMVRVQWDALKTPNRYAHSFVKHTLKHRINEEMVVPTEKERTEDC